MANGALVAAGIGLAGALGLAWWSKRAAAASSKSACESACIMGAKAAGMTGDLDALCAGSCGVFGNLLGAVRQIANPCPAGSHKEASVPGAPVVRDLRGVVSKGTIDANVYANTGPMGGGIKMAINTVNEKVGYMNMGYCVDDNDPKHIVGVLSGVPVKFTAYDLRVDAPVSMPPVVPVKDPTKTPRPQRDPSRGPQGGVSVT